MSGGQGQELDGRVLDALYRVVESRCGGDAAESYTAKLFEDGVETIARKVGEEAVETLIAGLSDNNERLAAESADLLYHLLVLWAARGVTPEAVWAMLEARKGASGLAEKAARGKD